jgi:hypothetical protein
LCSAVSIEYCIAQLVAALLIVLSRLLFQCISPPFSSLFFSFLLSSSPSFPSYSITPPPPHRPQQHRGGGGAEVPRRGEQQGLPVRVQEKKQQSIAAAAPARQVADAGRQKLTAVVDAEAVRAAQSQGCRDCLPTLLLLRSRSRNFVFFLVLKHSRSHILLVFIVFLIFLFLIFVLVLFFPIFVLFLFFLCPRSAAGLHGDLQLVRDGERGLRAAHVRILPVRLLLQVSGGREWKRMTYHQPLFYLPPFRLFGLWRSLWEIIEKLLPGFEYPSRCLKKLWRGFRSPSPGIETCQKASDKPVSGLQNPKTKVRYPVTAFRNPVTGSQNPAAAPREPLTGSTATVSESGRE